MLSRVSWSERAQAGAKALRLYLCDLSQTGSDERLLCIDIRVNHEALSRTWRLGIVQAQDGDCLPVEAFGRCTDPVSWVDLRLRLVEGGGSEPSIR